MRVSGLDPETDRNQLRMARPVVRGRPHFHLQAHELGCQVDRSQTRRQNLLSLDALPPHCHKRSSWNVRLLEEVMLIEADALSNDPGTTRIHVIFRLLKRRPKGDEYTVRVIKYCITTIISQTIKLQDAVLYWSISLYIYRSHWRLTEGDGFIGSGNCKHCCSRWRYRVGT
jgi:hypothetical protein